MNNEEMKNKIIELLRRDEQANRTGSRRYKIGVEILKRDFDFDYEV